MTKLLTLVAALVLGVAASATGAPRNNADPQCAARLKPYAEKIAQPLYRLDLNAGAGRLLYVGAEHANDPAHAQFDDIERLWNAAKPTMAFYEGPNRPVPASRDEAIRQAGESGFVRWLAARDKVALARLEPDPKEEGAYVLQQFTPEQTMLFYTLRETARLRERGKLDEAGLAAAAEQVMARMRSMGQIDLPIRSVADLSAAYARYWTAPAQWWLAPAAWFDPAKTSSQTGGVFTNEVNARSSAFRDLNMVNKLSAAALAGQQVFAVVGRDHVSHQAEALRCALLN